MGRWINPLLEDEALDGDSCEHCRTVTWAGVSACSCRFGSLAVDEPAVQALIAAAHPHAGR